MAIVRVAFSSHPDFGFFRRQRHAVVGALHLITALIHQQLNLLIGFHPFRHHLQTQNVGEGDDVGEGDEVGEGDVVGEGDEGRDL